MREPVSREEYRRAFDTIPFSDDFETRTQAMLRCRLQNLEKEESQMTVRKSRKWILAAAVAVALLALSVSAAVLWLTPAQVAEEIQDPLMHKIRCLDKLIDELAKGKTMDKILRKKDISQ